MSPVLFPDLDVAGAPNVIVTWDAAHNNSWILYFETIQHLLPPTYRFQVVQRGKGFFSSENKIPPNPDEDWRSLPLRQLNETLELLGFEGKRTWWGFFKVWPDFDLERSLYLYGRLKEIRAPIDDSDGGVRLRP